MMFSFEGGSHLNTKWTIDDMDRIGRFVDKGWRADEIASLYAVRDTEMIALMRRNGISVLPRRVTR